MSSLTCFFCREAVVGYVEELQRHINNHIRNNHFVPEGVFYDCLVPRCKARYDHFKSLKRHIVQQHPCQFSNNFRAENDAKCSQAALPESVAKKRLLDDNPCAESESSAQADNPDEPVINDTVSLDQITRSIALGICRLSSDVSLPQSKITEMTRLCEMLAQMLGEYFQDNVKTFLEDHDIDPETPETISFLNKFHLPSLFTNVSTLSKQTNFLKTLAVSIPNPSEKMLQTREDVRHVDGIPKKVIVNETFSYIPIIETLKLIFRNPDARHLLNDSECEEPVTKEYTSFRSGETYQNSEYFKQYPDAVRLSIYQDDVELGNALSSRAGINKVSVFDFKVQNFPPKWNSSPKTVFPLMYCTTIDAKKHGYNKLLKPLINDLKKLEEGVTVFYGNESYTIRAVVTMFCGDTLAVHEIFGLLGPMANFFCRVCTIQRPAFHQNPFENFPLRTKEWYDQNMDLVKSGAITPSECGLRPGGCILNELRNFHTTENFALDTMHDIAEGLVPLTVQLVLSHYYKKKELGITAGYINQRIHSFAYGYIDKNNRPSANFTNEMLSKPAAHKLKQTAAQNLLLLRAFPFLFGHKVSANCEYMNMIGHLINITRILMSTIVSEHMLASLEEHIRLYEELFYSKFKRRINKNHHLDHYVLCIKKSGNMKQFNCLVFEQKNKPAKNQSSTCRNFKNICKSLAQRQCFKMIVDILDNPFRDKTSYHGGKIVLREQSRSQRFLDETLVQVFIPKSVTINGIDFRPNLLVCIRNYENEYYPTYGIINEIVVINSKIHFLLKLCKTKTYNTFLEAYEVSVDSDEQLFHLEQIHTHTTFAFWTSHGNSLKFVSRRNYCRDY
nr:uncharacterized protein LOC115257890 [Aedes albopictus]